jgi:hypothetical protein
MSVSIMEALQNADYNLRNNGGIGAMFAKEQVHNATVLLDKGYDIWTNVDALIEKYGSVEDVPEIEDNPDIKQND